MSSTYKRICLSHNPPLILDDHFNGPITGEVRHEDHPECLMGVGRFSYPIIEFWDPNLGRWVDVTWARRFPRLAQAIAGGQL